MGKWINQLAIRKFSRDAIPSGGGLHDGIKAIADPELSNKMKGCIEWARAAILAVRNADEPNIYKEMTDEQIAQILVEEADKKPTKKGLNRG